jgi:hypothetical protein
MPSVFGNAERARDPSDQEIAETKRKRLRNEEKSDTAERKQGRQRDEKPRRILGECRAARVRCHCGETLVKDEPEALFVDPKVKAGSQKQMIAKNR